MRYGYIALMGLFSLLLSTPVLAQNPQRGLAVIPELAASGNWGQYHALIIGINDYQKWPRLQTAVKDATVLRDLLVTRYGFDKKNVILRTDKAASRIQINRDLRFLAQSMRPEDNLLVYYAGHGQLDDFTGDGYWVPAEGALKDPSTWVANSYIKAVLSSEKLQAKNVVVIADSCYSGSMLRGGPSLMSLDDRRYREKLAEKSALRSRQVISSGGVEPVADGGAEGHSLFAFYLIDALRKNEREVIDLENLFHTRVWKPVTEIGDQRPNVGRLKTPMDQDGQFVLYNAAWARQQAETRAALKAQKEQQAALEAQRQAAAKQKAAVASAEIELQRQRFEIEKQKLANERDQKAVEMERLKLEKQKQEIEYAKLQARLAEIEAKRLANEQRPPTGSPKMEKLHAAVDNKTVYRRKSADGGLRLALFPVKVRIDSDRFGGKNKYEEDVIRAVASLSQDDKRFDFALTFREIAGVTDNSDSFAGLIKDENQIWNKASLLAALAPNWKQVKAIGRKIDTDLSVLVYYEWWLDSKIDIYLYDHKRQKTFSRTKMPVNQFDLSGSIEQNLRQIVKEYFNSL
ncbi:MAG: hypothetical protein [Olavius algarvensis Delta 4 endosymbiont]|nr:MAG: hypothetical protein [Olavius algarvensis Delta 4 endosymbiont]